MIWTPGDEAALRWWEECWGATWPPPHGSAGWMAQRLRELVDERAKRDPPQAEELAVYDAEG